MAEHLIELRDVYKIYSEGLESEVRALDGISVAVAAPEDGLTQSDVALLSDIVLSQTSCKLSDIRVIGVEPEKGQ